MARYNFKTALEKLGRVVTSGRGMNYFNRASSLYKDIKNDYSNPAMGRRKKRSTPRMGKKMKKRR
jgi:hypothetical protein